ncbi:g11716 [Coccomyxa elongata]
MGDVPKYRLYKWVPNWGLPSISVACIQVEAYLRLGRIAASAEDCTNSSTSPSGQLPALEHGLDLVEGVGDEFASARAIISYLRSHGSDLDAHLTTVQQAELLAFAALVEAKLEPATLYTTWCEAESYNRHTRAAFAAGLPLPLNYWLPWNQQRAILRRFAGTSQAQVYEEAGKVYAALVEHLRSTSGKGSYFFGSKPSSLDAAIFAHLVFHHGAPVSAPELRRKLSEHPSLVAYVERISREVFSVPLPTAPPITSTAWAQRAEDSNTSPQAQRERRELSAKDKEWRRGNQMWLTVAGLAITAYFLLSGQYIQFSTDVDFDEDDINDEE